MQTLRFEKKGFTYIELIMTIVVLGILASVSLPRFFGQTERGRVMEAYTILESIRNDAQIFRLSNGRGLLTAAGSQVCGADNIEALGLMIDIPDNTFFEYCISASNNPGFNGGSYTFVGTLENLRFTARNPAGLNSDQVESLSMNLNENGQAGFKLRGTTSINNL